MTGRDGYEGPNPFPRRTLLERLRDWWSMRKLR